MSDDKWDRLARAEAAAQDIVGDRDCAVSVTVWAGTFSYAAILLSTTAIGN